MTVAPTVPRRLSVTGYLWVRGADGTCAQHMTFLKNPSGENQGLNQCVTPGGMPSAEKS